MAAMSKHERRAPFEQLRRNRLGDLWKLIENRYGSRVLPDDDAGRSDLFELLLVISLGERPAAKMQNTIETAAPWLSAEEAESMVAHITVALDRHERWCRSAGALVGWRGAIALAVLAARRDRHRIL